MRISRILAILILPERFWSRLRYDKDTSCWIWTGYYSGKGYGKFGFHGKKHYLHRLIWSLVNGTIPFGMEIRHSCDNPPCCNPFHLLIGTSHDNHTDMIERGRALIGQRNAVAKLTVEEILYLLHRHRVGETQKSLAIRMGISQTHVSKIIRGERWKHVTA